MTTMQEKILLQVPQHLREFAQTTFDKYSINTVFRASHFLSQVIHESGNFKRKEENLNYSADGLLKIFPKYFPDKATALTFERKPEAIANKVYSNRMGNGLNEGWKYRGRGFIQITGKDNYSLCGKSLGLDLINNPDLLLQDEYAFLSAGWFWDYRKINQIADKGLTEDVIKEVRKKVNGGIIGLQDVTNKLNEICNKI